MIPVPARNRRLVPRVALYAVLPLIALAVGSCQRTALVELPASVEPFPVASGVLDPSPLSVVLEQWRAAGTSRALDPAARTTLARYLATISKTGPASSAALFRTRDDRVAYYLNAVMAWTVALTVEPALLPRPGGRVDTIRFPLDGGTTTIRSLSRRLALMLPEDPRVALFTFPELLVDNVRPDAAVEGYALEWQLRRRGELCGRQPGFWALDAEARSLSVNGVALRLNGLPPSRGEKFQTLLRVLPPDPGFSERIRAVCGEDLRRCSLGVSLPS